jgi:GH43 family beta-xylosidase
VALLAPASNPAGAACFTNSLRQGQDPAVIFKDGQFHLAQSANGGIHLRRSATIAGLATASNPTLYTPPSTEGSELWAPEIHWLSNRWYLYYTLNTNSASNGRARRGFVAESQDSIVTGPYTARGCIFQDYWNIDGSVFAWNGQLYYLFSGEPVQGAQNIYLARMSNPWTLATTPVMISAPQQSWETIGDPNVNEGPWGFERGGQLFISYSASGCWTDDYTLGLLTLTGADPLTASAWTKTGPVFTKKPGAYGPGHNCVVEDGAGQWWNFYHANNSPGQGCDGDRRIRAQRVFWKNNGAPDFGSPTPDGSLGTDSPDFLVAHFPLAETSGTMASSAVCGRSGVVNGPAVWTNPGLQFDGASTFVDCGPAVGNDVQHQVTLAAWVRPDAFEDWAGLITKGTNVSPYALQMWGDGSVRFTANFPAGSTYPAGYVGTGSWNSTLKLTLGQWCHVMATYDGERVRFYFDGVADPYQPVVNLRFGVAFEPLVLGADFPGGDEFFKGAMRDVRVYGRALTPDELLASQNLPPVFSPTPSTNIVAGQNLVLPVTASDPNPGQMLRYQLVSAPSGALVNSLIGTFVWRPTLEQAPSTNIVTMSVTDNGSPSLGSTQSFTVTVRRPVSPILGAPSLSGTNLTFEVSGDRGPDYVLSTSIDLVEWSALQTTNPPRVPFVVTVPVGSDVPRRFYRVEHR